eukprot:g27037.t1
MEGPAAKKQKVSKEPTLEEKLAADKDYQKVCPAWRKNIKSIFLTREQINKRISELAAQISKDYGDQPILAVGLLNGAIQSAVRGGLHGGLQLRPGHEIFGLHQSEEDLSIDPAGKHVLIIEDLIDTGNTLQWVKKHIESKGSKSVKIVTLLDKISCRTADITVDYAGFESPNEFLVGYGMDFAEEYRCLPFVAILEPVTFSKEHEDISN